MRRGTAVSSYPFLLFLSTVATAQSPSLDQQLCKSVRALLQASYSDFNSIKENVTRHRDGDSDWVPNIKVPGSQDCDGQSDPSIASSVSCTLAETVSEEQAAAVYRAMVSQMRSCLDQRFVFKESQRGKPTRRSTPIKEASFEVKGTDDGPDGPAVRISLQQFHRTTRAGYDVTLWVDAKDKE
jgi:hypothetical protein